jgi:hypothetical protein
MYRLLMLLAWIAYTQTVIYRGSGMNWGRARSTPKAFASDQQTATRWLQ